jgi:uncharacterized protein YjiK
MLVFIQTTCAIAQAETPSLLDCYDLKSKHKVKIELPRGLWEISGLAVTAQDNLLAHNDEDLAIVEMTSAGKLLQIRSDQRIAFQLDYEGIAVANSRVNLISSKGVLVNGNLPFDKTPFEQWDTGLHDICEIEGLDFLDAAQTLVVLCKRIRDDKSKKEIRLLLLKQEFDSVTTEQISVVLPEGGAEHIKTFTGSGVVHVPGLDHFLVLSSNTRAIAELTSGGELVRIKRLKKKQHRQPEGIEITAAGDLIIANEGKSKSGYLVVHKQLAQCSLKHLFKASGLD